MIMEGVTKSGWWDAEDSGRGGNTDDDSGVPEWEWAGSGLRYGVVVGDVSWAAGVSGQVRWVWAAVWLERNGYSQAALPGVSGWGSGGEAAGERTGLV